MVAPRPGTHQPAGTFRATPAPDTSLQCDIRPADRRVMDCRLAPALQQQKGRIL